jgi:hypothetical protein
MKTLAYGHRRNRTPSSTPCRATAIAVVVLSRRIATDEQ